MYELYETVPKTYAENLRFRLKLREWANGQPDRQRHVAQMCKNDVLFFFNFACFLYEPRPQIINGKRAPHVIPFITWPHQDRAIKALDEKLGFADVGIEKSRGEGASWIAVLLCLHRWLFEPLFAAGLVSRNELAADNPDDPDSLMWKCLALGTRVHTPTGLVPIESLCVGDLVIGATGCPVRVVSVIPRFRARMCRVEFDDGTSTVCTYDHLWSVSSVVSRMGGGREHTYHTYTLKTTDEIASCLRYGKSMHKHWNWQLPPGPVVHYPYRPVPVDPYVLGVLLGDGSLAGATAMFASIDREIVDEVSRRTGLRVSRHGRCSWSIARWNRYGVNENPLCLALESLGVKNCRAKTKFIPDCYLFSSYAQRLDLLRGLMDTDGTVIRKSGMPYYTTISPTLASQVADLARSLGGRASVKRYPSAYTHNGQRVVTNDQYRVCVRIPGVNPFLLSRKAQRVRASKNTIAKRIVAVTELDDGDACCIKVSSDDGLFLLDGHVITHNCDSALKKLPQWLIPNYSRNVTKHVLKNNDNGSTIIGYSATGDVASGGRKTVFIMDELAKFPSGSDQEAMDSTQHVTDSRIVVSTPKGPEGAYYDIMHRDSSIHKIILDWKDNPIRNRGLFTVNKRGYPELVDEREYGGLPDDFARLFHDEYLVKLKDRGFDTETTGKKWSVWYVRQCLRAGATPQSIAQELDRDYGGSMSRFFSIVVLERLLEQTVKIPAATGDLVFAPDFKKIDFHDSANGHLRLWCELVGGKHPPRTCEYVVGADIASGLGGAQSSNSALSVAERATGKKVAEFASPSLPPEEFAEYAIALCHWFSGRNGQPGFLIWEDNGYGALFRNRVFESQFRNFYHRTASDKLRKKKSHAPGWITNRRTKRELLGRYAYSLGANEFVNPSREALNECKDYMNLPGGRVEHIAAESAEDPSGAGENHGDRVIADSLVNWVIQEQRERAADMVEKRNKRLDQAPDTSIYALRELLKKRDKKRDLW